MSGEVTVRSHSARLAWARRAVGECRAVLREAPARGWALPWTQRALRPVGPIEAVGDAAWCFGEPL